MTEWKDPNKELPKKFAQILLINVNMCCGWDGKKEAFDNFIMFSMYSEEHGFSLEEETYNNRDVSWCSKKDNFQYTGATFYNDKKTKATITHWAYIDKPKEG